MFQYKVKWYFDNTIIESNGLAEGTTYKEAMENISESYGENNIESCALTACGVDDSKTLEFKEGIESILDSFEYY